MEFGNNLFSDISLYHDINFLFTLISFACCMCMSFIIKFFYLKHSISLTGKLHIGSILPILSGIVFLVIVIVKSSLALSLGLVGALSIVRFRTPIKEPEELIYLFLAIAIGLGYGSGHLIITTVIALLILVISWYFINNNKRQINVEYNLVINWNDKSLISSEVIEKISPLFDEIKLIRFDNGNQQKTLVLMVTPNSFKTMDLLKDNDLINYKDLSYSFFEAKNSW